MASGLYGLESGLTASAALGEVTVTGEITDTPETVVHSNLVIGLTSAQFSSIFSISATDGTVTCNNASLSSMLADVINGDRGLYSDVTTAGSVTSLTDALSPNVYNFDSLVSALKTHLSPSTYTGDFKRSFVEGSLGVGAITNTTVYEGILSKYEDLGFFDSFNSSITGATKVLGTADNLCEAADILINGTFNGETIYKSIADAGTFSGGGLGSLNFPSGYALAITVSLTGSLSISLTYSADVAIASGSAMPESLQSSLRSTAVTTTINKSINAGNAAVLTPLNQTTGTLSCKVLLYRI